MDYYYVNKKEQANGDHEVHTTRCSFIPNSENRILLGYFNTCAEAVREAKKTYSKSNGCYYCCRVCHTS